MPLKKGATDAVFSHNVAKLRREGIKRAQALAIAFSVKRKAQQGKK